MSAGVSFQRVVVGPGALRLGDQTLPLRRAARGAVAEVTWRGAGYRVRAWTFGERRALLSAYVGGDGALDAAGLSDAALALLVRPVPEHPRDREVVALAALVWSATGGAAVAPPVPGVEPAAQAVRLAAATGWRPRDIDAAVAADVDRWFAALPGNDAVSAPERAAAPAGQDGSGQAAAPQAIPGETGDGFRIFRLED